jgi:hypothetical protein
MLSTFTDIGEGFSMCSQDYFDNRYDPNNNPNGYLAMPTSILSAARTASKMSNYYIKDASYLQLRNIQLAYNFDPELLKKSKISSARVYVSANNLFTITKYKGFNPDGSRGDILSTGLADFNYPVARSFVIGLNLSL